MGAGSGRSEPVQRQAVAIANATAGNPPAISSAVLQSAIPQAGHSLMGTDGSSKASSCQAITPESVENSSVDGRDEGFWPDPEN